MTPVDVALDHLGQREQSENQGPIVEWSLEPWTVDATVALPWCAGFVCRCLLDGGMSRVRQVASLSVRELWKRCTTKGWAWQGVQKAPRPGDLIFFLRRERLGHVGLIECAEPRANVAQTIEGNADDAVRRRVYALSEPQIYGFARIPSG